MELSDGNLQCTLKSAIKRFSRKRNVSTLLRTIPQIKIILFIFCTICINAEDLNPGNEKQPEEQPKEQQAQDPDSDNNIKNPPAPKKICFVAKKKLISYHLLLTLLP